MATLEELVVQLTAETSQLKAELAGAAKAVQQNTDKMDKAVEAFSKNSSKQTGFFQTAMATMTGFIGSEIVLGAFNKVKEAAAFMADQFLEGVESARAEEVALTKLANSLALNGNYTTDAMKSLQEFCNQMEEQTNIADDVVAANLSILSSITKLDSEGLKTAEKAAIDMSAAFGMDLESATRLVAKGIEGNVEAFKRYGITVTEGANKTENLKNIMAALAGAQGAAAGATKTFDGTLAGIKTQWGNLWEAVAKTVTQNQAVVAVFNVVKQTLAEMTTGIDGNSNAMKEWVAVGFVTVLEATGALVVALDTLYRTGMIVFQGLMTTWDAGAATLAGVMGLFSQSAQDDFFKIKESGEARMKEISSLWNGEGGLSGMAAKVYEMRDAAVDGFTKIGSAMDEGVTKPTVAAAGKVRELTEAQKQYNDLVKAQAQDLASQGASLDGAYEYQMQSFKNMLDQKLMTEQEYYAATMQAMLDHEAEEKAQLDQARANKLISETEYRNAQIGLARKNSLEQQKAATDLVKFEDQQNKLRAANMSSTLNTIASLSQSSNKTLASIGKAAAISTATMDGYVAVQKALSAAPPPFNIALAAAVGAATAANIAKIAGVGFAHGTDSVPGMGNRDSIPAMLTPGERVVPKKTNEDLTDYLANAGEGGNGQTEKVEITFKFKDEFMDYIETQLIERGRLGVSLQVG